jgi:amidase
VKGKRIAWAGDFEGWAPYEPGVLDVCGAALKTFQALGCTIDQAIPDYPLEKVWRSFIRLRGWPQGGAILEHYDNPAHRALLKPEAVWEVEVGKRLSAYEITADSVVRTEWSQAVNRFFGRYDYLIVPTAQVFPFATELHWPAEIAGQRMATYHEWMKAVCLVTMAGCPALAVPAGLSPTGLPMGFQIVAPVHAEMACLQLAAAYEAADPLAARRLPPVLSA